MVKTSVNRYALKRVADARKIIEINIQKTRRKAIKNLEEIFKTASKIARGEIKHRRKHGKMVQITLSQRKKWLHIAEQTAKTIKTITSNLNEKEVYTQLNQLEKLIHEINT